jgi:hypothetical protein
MMMTAGRFGWMAAVALAAVLAGCGDNTADNKTATVVGADVAAPTITEDKDEVELQILYFKHIDAYLFVQRTIRDGVTINVDRTVVGNADIRDLAEEHGVPLLERF